MEGARKNAPSAIALLREHGLHAKKALGQNFLLDVHTIGRIAQAATTPEGGTVVEIGPGLGALTFPMAARAQKVFAIERDRELVPILRAELERAELSSRVEVMQADALDVDLGALLASGSPPRVLAGNLPYLATGMFLERAVALASIVDAVVVMVQLEVAERLVAAPSTKTYGALTVFVRAAFEVQRLLVARAGAFHPRPEVDSAVVVLRPRPDRIEETESFRELVRRAFGMRRKTLRNAWRASALPFESIERAASVAGIDLGRRGETLTAEDFARVAAAL